MSTCRTFTTISDKKPIVLSRDQLLENLATSKKIEFTSAAMIKLESSSAQWLKLIWNYVECKPEFWRSTVTSPNTIIGSGSIRLALEIRTIQRIE